MIRHIIVLSLAGALGVVSAQAKSIPAVSTSTVFNVTGTFTDNATLSGTIDINTTTGTVTGGDLTVSTVSPAFTILGAQGTGSHSDYFADFTNGAGGFPTISGTVAPSIAVAVDSLDIYFDAATLIGYTGGALCSTAGNCSTDVTSYNTGLDPNLTGGTVTPATPSTPEPSTWMLVLAGPALFGLRRLKTAWSGRTSAGL